MLGQLLLTSTKWMNFQQVLDARLQTNLGPGYTQAPAQHALFFKWQRPDVEGQNGSLCFESTYPAVSWVII
jgi:hypothetical protein